MEPSGISVWILSLGTYEIRRETIVCNMSTCAGPPARPGHSGCPDNKRGGEVILCQGDLMLCRKCEHIRFPTASRIHGDQRNTSNNATGTVVHSSAPRATTSRRGVQPSAPPFVPAVPLTPSAPPIEDTSMDAMNIIDNDP